MIFYRELQELLIRSGIHFHYVTLVGSLTIFFIVIRRYGLNGNWSLEALRIGPRGALLILLATVAMIFAYIGERALGGRK